MEIVGNHKHFYGKQRGCDVFDAVGQHGIVACAFNVEANLSRYPFDVEKQRVRNVWTLFRLMQWYNMVHVVRFIWATLSRYVRVMRFNAVKQCWAARGSTLCRLMQKSVGGTVLKMYALDVVWCSGAIQRNVIQLFERDADCFVKTIRVAWLT